MSRVIVIPARYASRRYPGKPLVALKGAGGMAKTLLQRSWEAACAVPGIDRVVIATDAEEIAAEGARIGAEVVMTPESCRNGTERCAAALPELGDATTVVNLQGDAPLTPPWFITALVEGLEAGGADMATPVLRCDGATLEAFRADRRAGRVGGTTAIFDRAHRALYFSKEVVPFAPDYPADAPTPVFHHVGVYAYTPEALQRYAAWPEGTLEGLEGLEQLRFLEQGAVVRCVEVTAEGRVFWELNNPSDVPRVEAGLVAAGIA